MTVVPHKIPPKQDRGQSRRADLPTPSDEQQRCLAEYLAADSLSSLSSLTINGSDALTAFIVANYVSEDELSDLPLSKSDVTFGSQICGSWVEVLPVLCARKEQSGILPLAMKAFALSMVESRSKDEPAKSEYVKAYGLALNSISDGLSKSQCNNYHEEFAAASMCLTLSEVSSMPQVFQGGDD